MSETLYSNNTRTHTLALKENSFRGWLARRLAFGINNPNKDKASRRKRSRSFPTPVKKTKLPNTRYGRHLGIITQFTDEMLYSGNRRERRHQAKQEMALIRHPEFSSQPHEYTKRGLRFI